MSRKKNYQDLIKRVEAIDEDAAKYMRKKARGLMSFVEYGEVIASFEWVQTPQGFDYWNDISENLGELRCSET